MPYAGGSGTSSDPYQIETWEHLDSVRDNLDSYFILNNDLDSSTSGYDTYASSSANGGSGWDPIGAYSSDPFTGDDPFTGEFDGSGYVISDLYIDRGSTNEVGLFSYIDSGANISDVGVENVDITGDYRVGGLVGYNDDSVSDCYSTGSVDGSNNYVGGLIGSNDGSVSDSYSTASVSGGYAGGLIGKNGGGGSVSRCYSTGSVNGGGDYVGGLIGYNDGSVSDSFWDEDTSGMTSSDGGTGKTTAEMKDVATYTDTSTTGLSNPWDFVDNPNDDTSNNDYWDICSDVNDGYPNLTAIQGCPVAVSLSDSVDFSEDTSTLISASLSDSCGFTEDLPSQLNSELSGSLGFSESEASKIISSLTGQLGFSESESSTIFKELTDSLGFSESTAFQLLISMSLSDQLNFTEQEKSKLLSSLTDSLGFSEQTDSLLEFEVEEGQPNHGEFSGANDGTLYGGVTQGVSGVVGSGYGFDGSDDYVEIPDDTSISGINTLTLSAWVKIDTSGKFQQIINKWDSNGDAEWTFRVNRNEQIAAYFLDSSAGTNNNIVSNSAITTGEWTHIAVTYDGSTAKIYIDGSEDNSKSISQTIQDTSSNVYLGYLNSNAQYLNGSLDDVRIYNRALSESEIEEIYNSGSGTEWGPRDGLVGQWRLNEETGSTAYDSSRFTNGTVYRAYQFDGSDDYVEIPDSESLDITGELTMSYWIKPDWSNAAWTPFIGKDDGTDTNYRTWIGYNQVLDIRGGESVIIDVSNYISSGEWSHITNSFDGSNITTYIDGESVDTSSYSLGNTNDAPLRLGLDTEGGQNYGDGSLDDVRIYNRALSQSEIEELYNNGEGTRHGPRNGLISQYELEENNEESNTVRDTAGGLRFKEEKQGTILQELSDSIGFTENLTYALAIKIQETLNFTEQTETEIITRLTDNLELTEEEASTLITTVADNVQFQEELKGLILQELSEELNFTEQETSKLITKLNDTLEFTEQKTLTLLAKIILPTKFNLTNKNKFISNRNNNNYIIMNSHTFKVGDTGTPLEATLKDDEGKVDLSNITKVELYIEDRDGELQLDGATMTVTNATEGEVKYTWSNGDPIETKGIYKAEAVVTDADGETTFPNEGYATITVEEDIQ